MDSETTAKDVHSRSWNGEYYILVLIYCILVFLLLGKSFDKSKAFEAIPIEKIIIMDRFLDVVVYTLILS